MPQVVVFAKKEELEVTWNTIKGKVGLICDNHHQQNQYNHRPPNHNHFQAHGASDHLNHHHRHNLRHHHNHHNCHYHPHHHQDHNCQAHGAGDAAFQFNGLLQIYPGPR